MISIRKLSLKSASNLKKRHTIEMEWPPKVAIAKCVEIYNRDKLLEIYDTEPGLKSSVAESLFKKFEKQSKTVQWYWLRRASLENFYRNGYEPKGPVFSTYFFIKEQLALMEAKDTFIWKQWNVVRALQKKWYNLPISQVNHYHKLAREHNSHSLEDKCE